ncbi:hypothetical protein BN873_p10021 [Candidatus Competibacter denitrificans Run_A_D11]|uniref:Uncharacterized protein n=1 Tax=Candidatus Competibacter denitrificans Run_A_D11 TaxID=1400863 RepID=W6MA53_9GAMM|nr:hypothetical protein BN873_p10021 [Candidatus Competibacter denitrificans Run_A_D11]
MSLTERPPILGIEGERQLTPQIKNGQVCSVQHGLRNFEGRYGFSSHGFNSFQLNDFTDLPPALEDGGSWLNSGPTMDTPQRPGVLARPRQLGG